MFESLNAWNVGSLSRGMSKMACLGRGLYEGRLLRTLHTDVSLTGCWLLLKWQFLTDCFFFFHWSSCGTSSALSTACEWCPWESILSTRRLSKVSAKTRKVCIAITMRTFRRHIACSFLCLGSWSPAFARCPNDAHGLPFPLFSSSFACFLFPCFLSFSVLLLNSISSCLCATTCRNWAHMNHIRAYPVVHIWAWRYGYMHSYSELY